MAALAGIIVLGTAVVFLEGLIVIILKYWLLDWISKPNNTLDS